jgi:endopeptidase La
MEAEYNKLITFLSKSKSMDTNFSSLNTKTRKDMIKAELNISALTQLKNFIDKIKNIDKSKKSLNINLTSLATALKSTINIIKSNKNDTFKELTEEDKASSIAVSYMMLNYIKKLKVKLYSSNINKFIEEEINLNSEKIIEIYNSMSKKSKVALLSNIYDDEEDDENDEDDEENYEEYEEESDYNSTDDEDDYVEQVLPIPKKSEATLNRKRPRSIKTEDLLEERFLGLLNKEENDLMDNVMEYFKKMEDDKKKDIVEKLEKLSNNDIKEPEIIRVLNLNISDDSKTVILNNINSINKSMGDNFKLKQWMNNFMKLPLDKYVKVDIVDDHKLFLEKLKTNMDEAVFGHDKAKKYIIQLMAQQLRNKDSKSGVLGIWGPPGNGKTSLVKEGIAKTMGRPFVFISLAGCQDSSYLDGFSYTYEGSIYGRIVDGLIQSKCMNPIFYFDELDKVSKTNKGDEIINFLVHLIDPVQNCHFRDKYFQGIDIDLSKCTFIFSYNDSSYVNHILLDRITQVETKFLTLEQKVNICQNYLIKEVKTEVGIDNIEIENEVYEELVENYTWEGGVRNIKKLLYNILRDVNIKLILNELKIENKYIINKDNYKEYLKGYSKIELTKIHDEPKVGLINGMWAGSLGVGGILPIETTFYPSNDNLSIKATGSLMDVIKESTQVASTLAWNLLDKSRQNYLLEKWKNNKQGIHIHCPEGATPKDGPSAGTAFTVALLSLFSNKKIRNDIAITGEINLQGNVMTIGGLEEKLTGAYKAGVKLAIIPKGNKKDLKKIRERNPKLLDVIKVEIVENIKQVVDLAIIV